MERYTALGVLLFALVAIALSILFAPAPEEVPPEYLPWNVQPTADGSLRLFGITLGETTLQQAVERFEEDVEISQFVSADEQTLAVEAYFDSVHLGGLRAKVVVTLDLPDAVLRGIYQRGARIATMGSGTRKVTLSSADLKLARATPIASLTYLPRARLEAPLLEKHFGQPSERVVDGDSTHWLYPGKGIDIITNEKNKVVFQYLRPRDFPAMRARLGQKPGV